MAADSRFGNGTLARAAKSRIIARADYMVRLSQERGLLGPASATCPAAVAKPGNGIANDHKSQHYADTAGVGVQVEQLSQMTMPAMSGLPRSTGLKPAVSSKPRSVGDNFVNRVVEQCGPAVVRVEIEQKVEMPAMDNSDVFSFFFGIRPERQQQERRVRGHGSGFCIDGRKGLVLTNAHVVEGADKVTVSFAGHGAPLDCEVLEIDEVIDLAVLQTKKPPKSPLPQMDLGTSENLKTGDWAIVLGNPFGLQNTCTLGIVSSLDRSTGETGFDWMRHPLLQTDAAVNQGNSGGPMLNEVGQVIGMISMRALFGEGIGFAIPIDSIKSALPSLMQRNKVPRSYLGLKLASGPPGGRFVERSREGAYVEMVLPNSPAASAGLEVEDQIVEANGRKVGRFDELQEMVRSAKVGTQMSLKVRRGGEVKSLRVETADIRRLKTNSEKSRRGRGGAGPRQIIIMP
mmetsp:Transcript_73850/g.175803  ORF Transcript_73850/g.175803 Transcript_73850/m.175803 type:complete len:459 (-) Transcript_73850:70-1446(-)